ncbi:MAG TPA: RNA-binding protein [bacterium]|nr:RNA-binding protein [bacterium]HPN29953.1 RNA-binding protein [bacterium]
MDTKLYVGNLNWGITEEQLQNLFAQFGSVVSAKIITDRSTGRSKGFGFVEMSSQEEIEKAISGLNGKEFEGRALTVNIARPQEKRPQRNFDRNRGGSGQRRY